MPHAPVRMVGALAVLVSALLALTPAGPRAAAPAGAATGARTVGQVGHDGPTGGSAGAGTGGLYALGGRAALPEATLDEAAAEHGRRPRRIAGGDRFATAAAIAEHAYPDGTAEVYLASGTAFPDALAASTALEARAAALLLVTARTLPAATARALDRLAPTRIAVLGGRGAVGEEVLDRVEERTGIRAERIAGAERFATAAAIALDARPDGVGTAYLASGESFADALAASTAVAAADAALLLVGRDHLPAATADALERLRPARVVVLGGRAAVSDRVLEQVADHLGTRPGRIAGRDRVETAAAIARHAHPAGPDDVYLATSLGFADALAAGTAVTAHEGALLLVTPLPSWVPDLARAVERARSRPGSVSMAAIGTDGRSVGHRAEVQVPAASVLKVMFLVAYLQQPAVRDRPLGARDRELLEPMITRSANEPASRIADMVGADGMRALARAAGMQDFAYTRPWGQTRTSARDQARFLHDLPEHLPARHRAYALDLLTRIVPEQRWGVGQVDTAPWLLHLKGGWGSGTGAVTHQVVLLRHPTGRRAAAAVMVTGSPDHATGTTTLELVFDALLATLP
jgi:putative cell wall-binding protein